MNVSKANSDSMKRKISTCKKEKKSSSDQLKKHAQVMESQCPLPSPPLDEKLFIIWH